MKVVLIFLTLLTTACSNQPTGNKENLSEQIDLNVEEIKLSNGFKALLVPNKKIPVYALYLYYKVGAKYERKGITGATHFLEHMMFKGSKTFGAGRFDYLIEGNGGSSNAYTNNDFTVYYEKMPSPTLETMIEVEADRMQNLLLEEKAFNSERNVILEERRMRYENSPRGKLYLVMMNEMQKGTAYSESVIGSIEDLKSVTREQIHEYFKKFYAPNNAFMVIAGDFDVDKTKGWIKKHFSDIDANDDLEKQKQEALAGKGYKMNINEPISRAIYGTSPRPIFSYAFPGVKLGDRDAYVLDLVASILGGGKSSYLNQLFVEGRRPKLTNIYAANYNLVHNGVFFISGELLGKVSLKRFESDLKKSLKGFCQKEVNERNLQKVKNQILVGAFHGLDTNSGLATYIGDREAYLGDWKIYKKELSVYNNIKLEEARQVCQKYLGQKGNVFISLWNKNGEKVNL